mgnify:CR=1 FL=1
MAAPILYPAILSGGSGTRLWPLSRAQYPKQMLSLAGDDTMLQQAVLRLERVENAAASIIIGNNDHRFIIAEQLRQIITQRLSTQTPDPQVTVARVAGDGATVSVMGKVVSQGVYPIERPTRALSAMLARAGGVSIAPEIAVVTVKRGNDMGKVWLTDLYSGQNDIALRPGDIILVEEDQRNFTAIGALGGQTRVPLGNDMISAVEAIAMVGGLNLNLADPTGVFILREKLDLAKVVAIFAN